MDYNHSKHDTMVHPVVVTFFPFEYNVREIFYYSILKATSKYYKD